MSDILGKIAGAALQNMLGGGGAASGGSGAAGSAADNPLGAILGQILGGGAAGGMSGAIPAPQAAPGGGGLGGLSDLLQQFQQAGLGDKADSWVSAGENQAVQADDLTRVFSREQIEQWAAQAGTDPQSLLAVLSQALPHVVDRLTPHGEVPSPQAGPMKSPYTGQEVDESGAGPDLGAILGSLLGGRR